jgi:peptidyl-prolyl cis-trans isomerase D
MLGKASSGRESNTRFRRKPPRQGSILSANPALDYHARFARRNFGESRMLNVMRDNLRHLKWVLVVVALAMLGYLGSYFDPRVRSGGAISSDWAAKVDGHTIPTQEFLQVARTQDDYYRRLLGQQYESMKKTLKLGTQSIQSLIDRRLVLAEARAMGLSATKEAISKAILENPNFKDPSSGTFVGKERYADFIAQNYDGGVEGYERRLADDLLAQKWLDVMTASAQISDAELEQAWRTRNVRAAADYVFVASSPAPVDATVDEATIAAWYGAHASGYKRSESRKVRLVVVDRQAQVAKAKVSDTDVKADYDAHAAQYVRPEQRHARHILFKLPPGAGAADKAAARDKAVAALARAQKGEDFATLARSMSQDTMSAPQGGDLGWFGRGAMVKPFDDAVFSTPPGQFAPIVETEFGFHVLRVEEAREAGTTPFDEVKDSIRRRLELQRAQDLASAEAQRLAGEVKKPADLDGAAAKAGLKVEEQVVSAGDQAVDLGPSPEFVSAVLAMTAGQVSAPLAVARGLAIVVCTEILPPSVRPLAEVRDQVRNDVLSDRARQAALISARRVAASASLSDGAKAAKLDVKHSGDLTAGTALPDVGSVPELEAILFGAGGTVGAKGAVVVPGGAIAYEITRHDAFDPAKFEGDKAALRSQLLQQRRDQLTQGLIQNLRQKHTIEINQPLVDGVNG